MSNTDWVLMLERLAHSLLPVQALLTGFAYILGIVLVIVSLRKYYAVGNARARSGSGQGMFVPTVYLIGGAALIFIPSTLKILSHSVFGTDSILSYAPYNPFDFYTGIRIIIQTAGILWFIRGVSLLVEASNPGVQHGFKGLTFMTAGILSMNFEVTLGILNSMLSWLEGATLKATQNLGY
ncbi:MAG: type IV secretion protein IcmC [Legionellaceae bacterium]|nr:type IV secretion protein IcmC [Legionellaceae bacterium]